MAFPLLLNLNNQTSQNVFTYRLSRPIDFNQFEIALGSISIYYSWQAISSRRNNSRFNIIWPIGASTTTYNIALPNGTYSAADLDAYLKYWSIQNKLYLINDTTGEYKYFISISENPAQYALQVVVEPWKAVTGWTAAAGAPAFSTSGYAPQITILNDDGFTKIIGLTPATYPAAPSTSTATVISNVTPQVDPVASVIVGCSALYNPLASNSQVLHTFTSAGVPYGGLITSSIGNGISYCPMQGSNTELIISLYDQDMRPLEVLDPNVCIRLLVRPKQADMINF